MLPETEPERLGWVKRDQLLALNGRGRKPQYALADHYGLKDYPSSAGGCKLTEPHYAERLWDLRRNGQLKNLHAVNLLRYGRHFRLSHSVKAIVGRDASENNILESVAAPDDYRLSAIGIMGPTVLVTGPAREPDLAMAAQLCARYGHARTDTQVTIAVTGPTGKQQLQVAPATELDIERLKI